MLFGDLKSYVSIIFIPLVSLIPDYIFSCYAWLLFPTETQKLLLQNTAVSSAAREIDDHIDKGDKELIND